MRSIVGTFLEHSRIFYFQNGGQEEFYMGSADWMPRNLDKRVEILFPVEDEDLKDEVRHILEIQLADTMKAHELKPDNKYEKIDRRGKTLLCAQDYFCKEAVERAKELEPDPRLTRVFIPAEPSEELINKPEIRRRSMFRDCTKKIKIGDRMIGGGNRS